MVEPPPDASKDACLRAVDDALLDVGRETRSAGFAHVAHVTVGRNLDGEHDLASHRRVVREALVVARPEAWTEPRDGRFGVGDGAGGWIEPTCPCPSDLRPDDPRPRYRRRHRPPPELVEAAVLTGNRRAAATREVKVTTGVRDAGRRLRDLAQVSNGDVALVQGALHGGRAAEGREHLHRHRSGLRSRASRLSDR